MEALAVPRPLSRILLIAIGVSVGQLAWTFLSASLLAFASGQAVAAGTFCLAAIWSFRQKTTDTFNDMDLSSSDFAKAQRAARKLGTKSIIRAIWVASCVLMAGAPAASLQLAGYVVHWMVLVCGFGLAEAIYGFWLTSHLSHELQLWRDKKRVEQLESQERKQQLERLQSSTALNGWKERAANAADPNRVAGTLQRVP